MSVAVLESEQTALDKCPESAGSVLEGRGAEVTRRLFGDGSAELTFGLGADDVSQLLSAEVKLDAAAKEFEVQGHHFEQCIALCEKGHAMAVASRLDGEWGRALEAVEKAFRPAMGIAAELGNTRLYAYAAYCSGGLTLEAMHALIDKKWVPAESVDSSEAEVLSQLQDACRHLEIAEGRYGGDREGVVRSRFMLANALWLMAGAGDPSGLGRACAIYQDVVAECSSLGDEVGASFARINLSGAATALAQGHAEAAADVMAENQHPHERAKAFMNAAISTYQASKNETGIARLDVLNKALTQSGEAVASFEELGDVWGQALSLKNIGTVWRDVALATEKVDAFKVSIATYRRAAALLSAKGHARKRAEVLRDQGSTMIELACRTRDGSDFDAAVEVLEEALEHAGESIRDSSQRLQLQARELKAEHARESPQRQARELRAERLKGLSWLDRLFRRGDVDKVDTTPEDVLGTKRGAQHVVDEAQRVLHEGGYDAKRSGEEGRDVGEKKVDEVPPISIDVRLRAEFRGAKEDELLAEIARLRGQVGGAPTRDFRATSLEALVATLEEELAARAEAAGPPRSVVAPQGLIDRLDVLVRTVQDGEMPADRRDFASKVNRLLEGYSYRFEMLSDRRLARLKVTSGGALRFAASGGDNRKLSEGFRLMPVHLEGKALRVSVPRPS